MKNKTTSSSHKRDIEFLFEMGTLKNIQRSWQQFVGMDCANNLEHSFRVAFLALLIARMEGVKNEEKVLKMALAHDLAEARVSDLNYMHKVYTEGDEDRASHDMFKGTLFKDIFGDILKEYETRNSPEAKIVKDADNLDVDVEMKEFEERGSQLPRKWMAARKIIRNKKLYTKSAKQLWDKLQKSDVASWHLTTNKWYLVPNAGK
ncbi:MAG: HD domain-containing protein [bacterium]|nr:HD domain-containing protein [bacterium]